MEDVRHAEVRKLRDELTKEKDEERREVIRTALQLLVQTIVFLLFATLRGGAYSNSK